MRTAKGIKCSFNQEPTLCAKESGGIVNPAGIMIAKPTVVAPTQSGRQVYRPPGQTGPKVVNKPKNNVAIGGFNAKAPRQFGTAHKQANKVDVDSGIQQQLLALQQQILAMAPVTTKAPPPTVNINPSLVVQPNFQAVNQINNPPPMSNNLAACGAPQTTGRFMSVDSWETGFMGKIEVDINTMSTGWSVVVSFAEPIPVGIWVLNIQFFSIIVNIKTSKMTE